MKHHLEKYEILESQALRWCHNLRQRTTRTVCVEFLVYVNSNAGVPRRRAVAYLNVLCVLVRKLYAEYAGICCDTSLRFKADGTNTFSPINIQGLVAVLRHIWAAG